MKELQKGGGQNSSNGAKRLATASACLDSGLGRLAAGAAAFAGGMSRIGGGAAPCRKISAPATRARTPAVRPKPRQRCG